MAERHDSYAVVLAAMRQRRGRLLAGVEQLNAAIAGRSCGRVSGMSARVIFCHVAALVRSLR
jgi:hypothetical protein